MKARHLSTDESEVFAQLGTADSVAFGLDYDGTLAPIVARPELANARPEVVACVEALARNPNDLVAMVTGRSIEDLWTRAGTHQTWVLGRHGAQVAAPGGEAHLAEGLDETELMRGLEAVRAGIEAEARTVDGAFVEDKGAGFALHTRGVTDPAAEAALEQRLEALARDLDSHVLLKGKRVLELRPKGVDKGWAFTRLVAREAPGACVLYIGDDTTDEDAFRALDADAITVRVTEDPGIETAARYWVESPDDVLAFLQSVVSLRS